MTAAIDGDRDRATERGENETEREAGYLLLFGTALGSGGAVWERGEASDSPRTPTSELSARSTDNLLGRGRGVGGFTGRDRASPSLSPHLPGRIG